MKKWNRPGQRTEYEGLYWSWYRMHQRAGNKDGHNPTYADVTVCERWNSYDNFFDDMSNTWFKHAHLDKDIIKAGNRVYCKEYCKWVSKSENSKECIRRNGSAMKRPEVAAKVSGANNIKSRRVKCVETGKIYESCGMAQKILKISSRIRNAANPEHPQKTAGGYRWEYV